MMISYLNSITCCKVYIIYIIFYFHTTIYINFYYLLSIEEMLSEHLSPWRWSGNTLQVYEGDINNTLQHEIVEISNMGYSVETLEDVSTKGQQYFIYLL